MKINTVKLQRQEIVCDKWLKQQGVGVFEAVTGFGKTYVAIMLIKRMNIKAPEKTINVVVPSIKLLNDWLDDYVGYVDIHGLKNVSVYVVNTYTQKNVNWQCDFLIVDEVHHILSDEAEQFNKVLSNTDYKYFLGLTATLSEKERSYLENVNIKIVDTVAMEEASQYNYISDFVTYNLGIELNDDDKETYKALNKSFNSMFAKFDFNFELAMACHGNGIAKAKVNGRWDRRDNWRRSLASEMGWDGIDSKHEWSPKSIAGYAAVFNNAMIERKSFIYNCSAKIDIATKLISELDLQTIVFSESTKFADTLASNVKDKCGDIVRAYHSNVETEIRTEKDLFGNDKKPKKIGKARLKKEALSLFEDKTSPIRVLSTVKALDEGYNVENINLVIMASYTSSERRDTQRVGRGVRFIEGKIAFIVNLYIMSFADDSKGGKPILVKSQEEKWLKEKQNNAKVIWVNSVDEVINDIKARLDGGTSANKTQTVSSTSQESNRLENYFEGTKTDI